MHQVKEPAQNQLRLSIHKLLIERAFDESCGAENRGASRSVTASSSRTRSNCSCVKAVAKRFFLPPARRMVEIDEDPTVPVVVELRESVVPVEFQPEQIRDLTDCLYTDHREDLGFSGSRQHHRQIP